MCHTFQKSILTAEQSLRGKKERLLGVQGWRKEWRCVFQESPGIQEFRNLGNQEFRNLGIQKFQEFRNPSMQEFRNTGVQDNLQLVFHIFKVYAIENTFRILPEFMQNALFKKSIKTDHKSIKQTFQNRCFVTNMYQN